MKFEIIAYLLILNVINSTQTVDDNMNIQNSINNEKITHLTRLYEPLSQENSLFILSRWLMHYICYEADIPVIKDTIISKINQLLQLQDLAFGNICILKQLALNLQNNNHENNFIPQWFNYVIYYYYHIRHCFRHRNPVNNCETCLQVRNNKFIFENILKLRSDVNYLSINASNLKINDASNLIDALHENLRNIVIHNSNNSYLFKVFEKCKNSAINLSEILIGSFNFESENFDNKLKFLNLKISKLELRDCNLNCNTPVSFLNLCFNTNSLRYLSIEKTELSEKDVDFIIDILNKPASLLHTLMLDFSKIDDILLFDLLDQLAYNHKLAFLAIGIIKTTSEINKSISNILKYQNSTLKVFTIKSNVEITDECISYLEEALRVNNSLIVLGFTGDCVILSNFESILNLSWKNSQSKLNKIIFEVNKNSFDKGDENIKKMLSSSSHMFPIDSNIVFIFDI